MEAGPDGLPADCASSAQRGVSVRDTFSAEDLWNSLDMQMLQDELDSMLRDQGEGDSERLDSAGWTNQEFSWMDNPLTHQQLCEEPLGQEGDGEILAPNSVPGILAPNSAPEQGQENTPHQFHECDWPDKEGFATLMQEVGGPTLEPKECTDTERQVGESHEATEGDRLEGTECSAGEVSTAGNTVTPSSTATTGPQPVCVEIMVEDSTDGAVSSHCLCQTAEETQPPGAGGTARPPGGSEAATGVDRYSPDPVTEEEQGPCTSLNAPTGISLLQEYRSEAAEGGEGNGGEEASLGQEELACPCPGGPDTQEGLKRTQPSEREMAELKRLLEELEEFSSLSDQWAQQRRLEQLEQLEQPEQPGQSKYIQQPEQTVHLEQPEQTVHLEQPEQTEHLEQPEQTEHLEQPEQTVHLELPEQTVHFEQPEQTVHLEQPEQTVHLEQPEQTEHLEQPEQTEHLEQPEQTVHLELPEQTVHFEQPEQTVHFEQPEQTVHLEQPEQTEHLEQPEQTEHLEQPEQTVHLELPEQTVHLELPEQTVHLEQPEQTGNLEQPEQTVLLEQPEQTVHLEQPEHTGHLEQPEQTGHLEQPEQTVHLEQPEQTVHLEQPEQTVHLEQPEQTVHLEQPEQTVHLEQPEQTVHLEQPEQTVHLELPEQTMHLEQPEQTGHLEQPEQMVHLEQPEQTVHLEQPEHTVHLEQPEHTVHLEQPEQTVHLEQPEHTVHLEQPEHTVHLEQPEQTVHLEQSEQPEQMVHLEQPEQTVHLEQPEQTVHLEQSEQSEQPEQMHPADPAQPCSLQGTVNGVGVDRAAARRLAERLYKLKDFRRTHVVRHMDKDNEFSRVVGEEYLKFFDFTGQTLDQALRSFMSVVVLIGETQERERVLQRFSERFHDCNPNSFSSSGAVLTLTCAVMLLNTDLHGQNVGKPMSMSSFVSNLDGMNEGGSFHKEMLKGLYSSIKSERLQWAIDEEELKSSALLPGDAKADAQASSRTNPFQDIPHDEAAAVFKEGFLTRKAHADIDGKRTPWGKRSWKTFYAVLKGMVLYLMKDQNSGDWSSAEEVVSVHHSLALPDLNYTKRPHVFRLQTADWRVYLLQASSTEEVSSWMCRINLASALYSSPPFPAAVGSQRRFSRPILPAKSSPLTLERKMQSHSRMLESFCDDLRFLQEDLPSGRKLKSRQLEEHRLREEYLQHEKKRYEVYVRMLEVWQALGGEVGGPVGGDELQLFDREVRSEAEEECQGAGLKKSYSSPSLDQAMAPPNEVKIKRNISERRTCRKVTIQRRSRDI
ncbi:hypothetical protein COCON_G00163930 [Conger conger]|uniref:PH and SEC7 domain-containing protein 4-like n=1 Tax=Conger conger TaxID=82655 RepID=A0A9Q1D745_CONCO|nr:hypothetical protein COCON_G00163930 [Conger conger]